MEGCWGQACQAGGLRERSNRWYMWEDMKLAGASKQDAEDRVTWRWLICYGDPWREELKEEESVSWPFCMWMCRLRAISVGLLSRIKKGLNGIVYPKERWARFVSPLSPFHTHTHFTFPKTWSSPVPQMHEYTWSQAIGCVIILLCDGQGQLLWKSLHTHWGETLQTGGKPPDLCWKT